MKQSLKILSIIALLNLTAVFLPIYLSNSRQNDPALPALQTASMPSAAAVPALPSDLLPAETDQLTGQNTPPEQNQRSSAVSDEATSPAPAPAPAAAPAPEPAPTPAPEPAPVADTRCIVTVSGSSYDVSKLRTTHSGGDVFTCGTDLTALYTSQHGNDLNLISPYRI